MLHKRTLQHSCSLSFPAQSGATILDLKKSYEIFRDRSPREQVGGDTRDILLPCLEHQQHEKYLLAADIGIGPVKRAVRAGPEKTIMPNAAPLSWGYVSFYSSHTLAQGCQT